jgi:hypothetical protein
MPVSSGEINCKTQTSPKKQFFTYHFHQSEELKDWLLVDPPIPTSHPVEF